MSRDMSKNKPINLYKNVKTRTELSEEEIEDKITNLLKFFDETGIAYDKFENKGDSGLFKALQDTKLAYPNSDYYMQVPGQRDTQKWIQVVREIYSREKNGLNRIAAIKELTNGWKLTETFDFLNWLKYYEENSHLKYKYAQLWYENGAPGYFLQVNRKDETSEQQDVDLAKDVPSISAAEKKSLIEKQRKKIIGRLDSVEKLLRSENGQIFADKELESLLEVIYQLKKKIQMVNKISASSTLYEDMIVREANVLSSRGFKKAAYYMVAGNFIYKIAQETPKNPGDPAPDLGLSGLDEQLKTNPGLLPENTVDGEVPKGIQAFLENLDTAGVTVKDDELEVVDEDHLFVSEAQVLPPPKPIKPTVSDTGMEVTENGSPDETLNKGTNFDQMIDSAFANLKVDDVVAKLEDLAKIFKTREIPRQLAIVDMMLDSLGLASYFPSLSEATNKALDSNNYISTRVEDILSKLRGVTRTREVDLKGEDKEVKPEVENIKNNLQQDEEKEKARKEQRKQQQNQELDQEQKETPEIEVQEDLAQPAAPKAPSPIAR